MGLELRINQIHPEEQVSVRQAPRIELPLYWFPEKDILLHNTHIML